MKTKKFIKRLSLNKKTIANLSGINMHLVKGGETDSICIDTCTEPETEGTCDLENSDPCYTYYCQGSLACGTTACTGNCP